MAEVATESGTSGRARLAPPRPSAEGRGRPARLPLRRLAPDPALPPAPDGGAWVDELARSLEAEGQVEPLRARAPAQAGGPFRVFHGRARLAAARSLGLEALDVVIERVGSDREAAYRHFAANQARPPSPLEAARLTARMVELEARHKTSGAQARVAARLRQMTGRGSEPTISRHVRVARAFSPEALDAAGVEAGELSGVSLRKLYEAARLEGEERRARIRELAHGRASQDGGGERAARSAPESLPRRLWRALVRGVLWVISFLRGRLGFHA